MWGGLSTDPWGTTDGVKIITSSSVATQTHIHKQAA